MKEALKNDRARIQVGRISSFGLMEMSRQRLRTGVLEASTKPCPHCDGSGLMRTRRSAGLSALRIIEDEAARGRGDKIVLRAGTRRRGLRAQQEARRTRRDRTALRRIDRGGDRRELRRRPDDGRELGSAAGRGAARRTGLRSTKSRRGESSKRTMEAEEDEAEGSRGRERSRAEGDRQGRRRRRRRRGGRGRSGAMAAKASSGTDEGEPRRAQPTKQPSPRARAEPTSHAGAGKRRRRRRGRKAGDAAPKAKRSSPTARRWSSGRSPRNRRSPRPRRPRSRSPSRSRASQESAAETRSR